MALQIEAQPVPLEATVDGIIRVRGSRVTLDTVVGAFRGGSTAEEIQSQYSTLSLGDIYGIIAFYLGHQVEVDAYLREREVERGRIRVEIETRFPPDGVRERLLARRAKGPDATSGGR